MEQNGQPALAEWLAAEMKRRGLGQRELAEQAGLVHSSVGRALDPLGKVSFNVCSKLAYALGVSPAMVLELAGLLPRTHPTQAEERDLLFLFRQLKPEQKEQVIDFISYLNKRS
jgi:transcriptional regulator with XRE-family HTH domain